MSSAHAPFGLGKQRPTDSSPDSSPFRNCFTVFARRAAISLQAFWTSAPSSAGAASRFCEGHVDPSTRLSTVGREPGGSVQAGAALPDTLGAGSAADTGATVTTGAGDPGGGAGATQVVLHAAVNARPRAGHSRHRRTRREGE